MSEISGELARVRVVKKPMSAVVAPESPLAASIGYRDSLKAKIKDVVARVTLAESRLAASQRRITEMTGQSDSLKSQFAQAEQTMNDLRATLENQRSMIAALQSQVDTLKEENTRLAVQNGALQDTLKQTVTENNTVYYVIGTKDELKQKGIVLEEGSKFLFFGAKTLVPGWNLKPSEFTKVDRRQLAELSLPKDGVQYRIVSRQNLTYLGEPATKDGKVKGSLHITDSSQFWAPSRFLIIVQG